MQPEMMNLFATPVYKAAMGRGFTDAELQFCQSQLKDPAFSIANYSSKNKNVLAEVEMQLLREIIQNSLNDYFKTVYNTSNKVSLAFNTFFTGELGRDEFSNSLKISVD